MADRTGRWLLLALVLGGCANPLASRPGDYGPAVAPQRLRAIRPAPLPAYARPDGATHDDQPAPPWPPPQPPERVELSIEQARVAALANNLNLRVRLIDPAIANATLSEEEARFEASFTLSALWSATDSPTASELESSQAQFGRLEPGVTIPLRTGGTASVSLPTTYTETDNEFATLDPAYSSDLELSLSQPLLRDAGRRNATSAIRIAAFDVQRTEAQTKLNIIAQLAETDRTYWRLYQARQELEVRQQEYELAVEQLQRAQRLEQAGQVAEIEVIRAQAGVAERLDAIIRAHNTVLVQQRRLKELLQLPGLDVGSATEIVPISRPDPVRYELDPAALAEAALAERMELLDAAIELLQNDERVRLSRHQLLPILNLTASYTINGLGGDLDDSLETLAENRFEDWSVGLNAEVPLGNQAARSRLRRAILTRLRALTSREALRVAIEREVHDAADTLAAGWQRILASRQSVILNTRALQAEQRQFEVGLSTSTDVLDAAARLANARSAEILAITDYQVAQIDLAVATGTLLGAARIQWEPADESAYRDIEARAGDYPDPFAPPGP